MTFGNDWRLCTNWMLNAWTLTLPVVTAFASAASVATAYEASNRFCWYLQSALPFTKPAGYLGIANWNSDQDVHKQKPQRACLKPVNTIFTMRRNSSSEKYRDCDICASEHPTISMRKALQTDTHLDVCTWTKSCRKSKLWEQEALRVHIRVEPAVGYMTPRRTVRHILQV